MRLGDQKARTITGMFAAAVVFTAAAGCSANASSPSAGGSASSTTDTAVTTAASPVTASGATSSAGSAASSVPSSGSSDPSSASTSPSNTSVCSGAWTDAQVSAVAGADHPIKQVYAVPCTLPNKLTIAFLNPGENIPYFRTWHDAMEKAAQTYGVDFTDLDLQLKFDNLVNQYHQMAIKEPDVVGTFGPNSQSLLAPTRADKIPFLPFGDVKGAQYTFGATDETATGKIGGAALAKIVKPLLDTGAWKGRNLLAVELTDTSSPDTLKRTEGGVTAFRESVPLADTQVVKSAVTGCLPDTARTVMNNVLTAHPNDVLVVFACNDEVGIAALSAIDQAHRGKDVQMVTYGGDDAAQAAMKKDTTGAYACMVDFNAYAQGWNWMTAAVAVANGQPFKPYAEVVTQRALTRSDLGAPAVQG